MTRMRILHRLRTRPTEPPEPRTGRNHANQDPAAIRDAILSRGLDAGSARTLAEALERAGRHMEAVEAFTLANRCRRDPEIERRLVRLRHTAFREVDRSLPPPAWPPPVPVDGPGTDPGPLVVDAAALTPGVLRRGICRHGCVWARGMVPRGRLERLTETIDRAFEGQRQWHLVGRAVPPDFEPFEALSGGLELRAWVRGGLGVLAADSPRALYEFLETIHELRIAELIGSHLGERVALSAEKTTLRRVDASPVGAYWHQDGAFLGTGVRTVNAWFALSTCGRDAPGLDVMPLRLNHLLPTGDGVMPWAVSQHTVERKFPGLAAWRPEFEAGDVLFFDHMLLHRTAAQPGMTRLRYGIESWFFAVSAYPGSGQTPILV